MLVLAALFSATPALAIEAEPTGSQSVFEGLPWGATEARIREVFGTRVAKKQCTDKEREAQAARPDAQQCDSPIVDDYTIDGITFRAFFKMGGPDGTLNGVRLDRVATVTNDQIKAGEGAEFRFNRVKAELVNRYGEPADAGKPQTISKSAPTVLGAKWSVDGTLVNLTDMVLPDKRGQMYFLSVVYTPIAGAVKSGVGPTK